jgi:cytochrome b
MRKIDNSVLIWDLKIRLFHWILVLGFVAAYLSARFHLGFLHTLIGYFLCFLLLARILLGFTGSQYARFNSFTFSATETISYIRTLAKGKPRHYFGHNPAGALMVYALLITLTLIFISGLATLAVIDFEGPLQFLLNHLDDNASYAIHHLHAWLIDVALVLILLHLFGVVMGSIQHKENFVKAMFTGKKKSYQQTFSEKQCPDDCHAEN